MCASIFLVHIALLHLKAGGARACLQQHHAKDRGRGEGGHAEGRAAAARLPAESQGGGYAPQRRGTGAAKGWPAGRRPPQKGAEVGLVAMWSIHFIKVLCQNLHSLTVHSLFEHFLVVQGTGQGASLLGRASRLPAVLQVPSAGAPRTQVFTAAAVHWRCWGRSRACPDSAEWMRRRMHWHVPSR